ncbi:MAG TPA: ion transporter [Pyrinomonadaceae bacterium]|nr:ion transporter [Pyrinomonadaceae bacterium]
MEQNKVVKEKIKNERREILTRLEDWLETPLLILGFVWLALLIFEFVWGENPYIESLSTLIYVIFIVDFAVKFLLAPDKTDYLKNNWITLIALAVPALRIFRIFRVVRIFQVARVTRGLRLVRVLTSFNRGMKSLAASFGRRGINYVLALTLIVLFAGAAGMYAFEKDVEGTGIESYGTAVWWTAMILTTMGSDYFPRTGEGRVLSFLLALYAYTIFGYVTATLATFFIEQEAVNKDSAVADAKQIKNLQDEIKGLREEMRILAQNMKN